KRAYCLKTQPATGETYPKSDLFNKALFRWRVDETGFSTVVKTSKNYSLAQKSIACARLG
ncbi:hypothetical protein, partial [Klebsiella pneumoniae]|uniref:hypothetical protein n=1 Tax=Klebsiella pneumoniae TaxID=573 RepID=UPI002413A562